MHFFKQILFLLPFLLVANSSQAQEIDTTEKKLIHIVYSQIGEGIKEGDIVKNLLYGEVILRQDSMYMYCDTAILIDNNVDAFGHIVMSQGDTLNIWADSLSFVGDDQMAYLKDSVVLKNNNNYLYTSSLAYDVEQKIATYDTFSQLTNDTIYVMSKRGIYYLNSDMAYLRDSVIVEGEEFFIKADSMNYNVKSKKVDFISKTLILQDSSSIYCEEGYYNIKDQSAYFTQNAQFRKGNVKSYADEIFYSGDTKTYRLYGDAHYTDDKIEASADTIIYDATQKVYYLNGNASFKDSTRQVNATQIIYNEKDKSYETKGATTLNDESNILMADEVAFDSGSDMGVAKGNVIWRDTVQNIALHSDEILFDKKKHFYQSFGSTRPWLEWIQETDTLYISADTILTEGEGNQYMKAFSNVKILGKEMSGLCDSLVYAKQDFVINLYDNPIVWMDSTQLTGDTISLFMRNGKIDSLRLSQKAFVIDNLVKNTYDQIKGKYIDGQMKDGKLKKMFVNKNAQAIYYIRDEEKKFIGVNKSICSNMIFTMGEDNLKSVLFLVAPEFEMLPMRDVLVSPPQLEGFIWRFNDRPTTLESIK